MLKQTVTYTDYNDEVQTEVLYFNLSRADLSDNLDLEEQYRGLYRMFQGESRTLKTEEVTQLLDFIKRLIRISYGKRSPDGRLFRKSEEIFDDFKFSGAYDEFLWSLFQDTEKAISFMNGIMPEKLAQEAKAALDSGEISLDANGNVVQNKSRPAWLAEGRLPTPAEIRAMSPDELALATLEKKRRLASQ